METKIKEAGLAGNLRTVPLSDLLQLISSSGKTGMLSITREDQTREIYFMKGNIIQASSSGNEEMRAFVCMSVSNRRAVIVAVGESRSSTR